MHPLPEAVRSDTMVDTDHHAGSGPAEGLRYKRSRFTTRLPAGRRYTAAHMWLAQTSADEWRIGFTKFAVRMLGEVVESGFEVKPGGAVEVGQVIGWLEGFKASTDLYCAMAGEFLGANPLLSSNAERIHADPYGDGWLYRARGTVDPLSMDVHAYAAVLDRAIDKIQGEEHSEEDGQADGGAGDQDRADP
jgi:glycine cleavage system H protein